MMKPRYYKDYITQKPHQFWVVKQVGENRFKIIYITKGFQLRGVGDILDDATTFATSGGHHTIKRISQKEVDNLWLYGI